jgi:hypothetical protein
MAAVAALIALPAAAALAADSAPGPGGNPGGDAGQPGGFASGGGAPNLPDNISPLVLESFILGTPPGTIVTTDGAGNTATITQSGTDNALGNPTKSGFGVVQDGRNNALTVQQKGHANQVGISDAFATEGLTGVGQTGRRNVLTVIQESDPAAGSNTIDTIHQVADPSLTRATNVLAIIQVPDRGSADADAHHSIGSITQTNLGGRFTAADDNVAAVTQTGGGATIGNTLGTLAQQGKADVAVITQDGIGNSVTAVTQIGDGDRFSVYQGNDEAARGAASDADAALLGNRVGTVAEIGDGNSARIVERGRRNVVAVIRQDSTGHGGGNAAAVGLWGTDNGNSSFSGAAAATGVTEGEIDQTGGGSAALVAIVGDGNRYGVAQDGEQDSASAVVGSGDDNQVALAQHGDANVADAVETGSRNLIALGVNGNGNGAAAFAVAAAAGAGLGGGTINATGDDNSATITITGDGNAFATAQTGNGNVLDASLAGNGGQAVLLQAGNGNATHLVQSGNGNVAVVLIHGDGNGVGALPAAAGAIALRSGLPALAPGVVAQIGGGNSVLLAITGNGNAFATLQAGNGNSIDGSVAEDGNGVVIAQVGANNGFSFSQIGNNNQITVSQ